tara:strand:- start:18004 stop:18144 length:141 start_codon:yes stop_codon:yes gene_type:complete
MIERPRYYRRNGTPYEGGTLEWAKDFDKGNMVARHSLEDGKVVSTV